LKRPHIKINIIQEDRVRSMAAVPVFDHRFSEMMVGPNRFQFIIDPERGGRSMPAEATQEPSNASQNPSDKGTTHSQAHLRVTVLDHKNGCFYAVRENQPLHFQDDGIRYFFNLFDEIAPHKERPFSWFVATSFCLHLVLIPAMVILSRHAEAVVPQRVEVVQKEEIDKIVKRIQDREEIDRVQNIPREVEQIPAAAEKPKSRIISEKVTTPKPQRKKPKARRRARPRRAAPAPAKSAADTMSESLDFLSVNKGGAKKSFGAGSGKTTGSVSPFSGAKTAANIGGDNSALQDLSKDGGGGPITTTGSRTVGTGSKSNRGDRNVEGLADLSGLKKGKVGKAIAKSGSLSISGAGQISEKMLGRILRKHQSKFTYCYERALLSSPGLGGKMVMGWRISTKGKASKVKIKQTQLKNAKLEKCVKGVIKKIDFSSCKVKGGSVDVKYPLVFKSSSL
jgi:hypothetical protein